MTWIYLLRNKSDVSTLFSSFLTHVKTQYKSSIKCIRFDNSSESAFPHLIKEHDIVHQFSCTYTPQQNSVVERKHQHILNVARALMFQSNIPLSYWSDCAAVFIINRTPSLILKNKSPYELLTNKTHDYSSSNIWLFVLYIYSC